MMIKINNLSKRYPNKKYGLYPLNYEIKEGTIVALTGGNGAGKSTFIKLLTGIVRPTTGNITWNRKKYSYMPDDLEFPEHFTALEALEVLGALKNVKLSRCLNVLEYVGLYDVRNEKIGTFSKGMKQRLSFAQVLLADEEALILDEPTNGLDPYWLKWLKESLVSKKESGKTIIFSTHDLTFAEQIADEVLFFYSGSVLLQQSMQALSLKDNTLENIIVAKLEELNGKIKNM